ncbi:MAG: hypothetical protein GYB49_11875 [Alphaproteobacteria bacterium]|nr:hypothetical protein [Hyphomonas sp.]MBR9807908.1 hypothetical protein [Alphaproteobacteria bacterium]
MSAIARHMPVVSRGSGRWTGHNRMISPDGKLLDSYTVDTLSRFPTDGSADYSLHIIHTWPHGKQREIMILADYRNNQLEWRDRVTGQMREIDDTTVYVTFAMTDDPSVQVRGLMNVSPDGTQRARTWHWFKNEKLFRLSLAWEERAKAS